MAIRDEVRILKSNTLEEFRQKSNELSIRNVGDDNLIHTNIGDKKESFTAAANRKFYELSGRFEILPDQTIDKTTGVAESYRVGAVRVTNNGTALVQGLSAGNFKVPNYTLKITLTGTPTIPSEFVENAVLTQSGGFSGTLLSASNTQLRFKSFTGTFNTGQNLGIPHTDASKRVVAGNISAKTDIDAGHGILIEMITAASGGEAIVIDSTSLVDAVNELQDDVGIVENLSTGQKVLTLAVNEHETDLYGTGNVTFSGLSSTGFQDAIEEVRTELGAHTSLGTTHTSDVVGAVNELETAIRGSGANYTLGTDASNIVAAINEIETGLRGSTSDYTTTVNAGSITQDIDTLDAELGTITSGAMGTSASTVSAAIAEHETQLGNVNINSIASGNNTITGALVQLHTELGSASLNTNATTHTGAINELELGLRGTSNNLVATDLSGMTATNIVSAILEHEADIGDMTFLHGVSDRNELSATNISAALQELSEKKLDLIPHDADSALAGQTLKGNIFLDVQNSHGTFKFKTGTTLDLSDATLLVSAAGGIANFGSAFLNLDANTNVMGLQVDRDHVTPSGSMTNHDVRLQWNETKVASAPDRAWQLLGMTTSGASNTADVVTFYNAQDLVANNTESGISVTWDATAQNFDFNVADPTLTFTSSTFRSSGNLGQGTITDLGNTSFALTANQLALGDNEKVLLGTGGDLSLFHNGNNSFIREVGTGSLFVESDNTIHLRNLAGSSTMATFTPAGATTLFHSNSARIATSADGVSVTGDVIASDYIQGQGIRAGSTGTDPGDGNLAVNNNAEIGGNLTVTGNLTVNGTQTSLNVATLEVEDTLILTGTSSTEPTTGGFGIETKSFTGVGTHSNAASNVTGSHSIVYNFATDRWEADGSLILSEATLGNASVEGTAFGSGKNLVFSAGSGLSEAVSGLSGNTYTVTYTNTDKGSSQNIFKTITADSGGSAVANSNTDTLTLAGGDGLNTVRSGDTITIHHDNTSDQSSITASANTFINAVTLDEFGHVQGLTTNSVDTYDGWALTVGGGDKGTITENERVSFEAGNGLDVSYSATNNVVTFSHEDTSSQASVNNSGTTFIQDVTLDTYGHVTQLGSGSFTLGDGTLTIATSGTGISGGGTFSANQTGNATRTITLNSAAASTPDTVVLRDGAGDIVADLFKTDDAANIASGNITKLFVESGNDGFINYGQPAAVRQFLNVANGATNTTNPNNATITVSGGTSIDVSSGSFTTDASANKTITINHADTSTQASVNNSGRTYIQDITLDTHGHITGITSATETVTNTNTVTSVGVSGDLSTGNITLAGSGATSVTKSGGTITIASTDTNTNTVTTNIAGTGVSVSSGTGNSTISIGQAVATSSNPQFNRLGIGMAAQSTNGRIDASNDIVAFSTSDERLKENVKPLENALLKVSQLSGVEFDWKELSDEDKESVHSNEGHDVGVLAQEVEKVLPEVVTERETGYKAVKYEKIVPLLIEAIKDLKSEIEELKSINKKV